MKNNGSTYGKWIYFAEEDFNFARLGFEDKFYSHVCFLSQQVVEKSCKAFLIYSKINYPKTHKIVDLVNSNKKLFSLLSKYINELKVIDTFYIPTRYPDGIPGSLNNKLPNREDAKESLEVAESVLSIIKGKLV